MKASEPISEATSKCLRSFTACLSVQALMQHEWAENRLADFNLWISGSGALAAGRASLDSRLATRTDARDVITNLLRLLATIVDRCKMLAETERLNESASSTLFSKAGEGNLSPDEYPARPFSPWSDDSASDTLSEETPPDDSLHEAMRDTEKMLDQLVRIIVAVRRSGRRSRLTKADKRFKPSEHEELKQHLATMLSVCPCPGSSPKKPDLKDLSEVQQRLIHCNLKRRNRFLYAQRHSQGLGPDSENSAQGQEAETVVQGKDEKAVLENRKSRPAGEVQNPTLRTGTSASAVSDSLVLPAAELLPASGTSTVMSATVIELDYPRPPKISEAARVFRCPCCCETLPVDIAKANLWKRHVADDLSPYTCILPGCNEPEVLFATKENWRRHLLKGHSSVDYWVCFACGNGNIQFHSEDAFVTHTRTKHSQSVEPGQIPLLTTVCRRSVPAEIRACPLCNWPKDEEGEADKDALLDHIAKGIHSFSLRALPWADDNGQETDERIDHSANKVSDWLLGDGISEIHSQDRPDRAKRVYASKYFQSYPYFAVGSEASNSSDMSTASWEIELERMKKAEISRVSGNSEVEITDEQWSSVGEDEGNISWDDSKVRDSEDQLRPKPSTLDNEIAEFNPDRVITDNESVSRPVNDHWAKRIFLHDLQFTPIPFIGLSSKCFGETTPEVKQWLEDFNELLELTFEDETDETENILERGDMHVYFYLRESDHRARIMCEMRRGGESDYYCLPLNLLEVVRYQSCLRLCRPRRGRTELVPWANLNFSSIERMHSSIPIKVLANMLRKLEEMILFFCTFLALRSQDAGRPVDNIRDFMLDGEEELFGG
ncbi:hypothetical protein PHISCL_03792 [Aspergillus sclerotialis]|uniref:C2H2-type domain-containing protein n=1 Tax=Aspergillus sclerotialis TaxID=2070753 RepID=A0A3A2ZMP9_9EURO|nr:hypothetical protein PHISCL_03792 [Aspergillus sclerotialis]